LETTATSFFLLLILLPFLRNFFWAKLGTGLSFGGKLCFLKMQWPRFLRQRGRFWLRVPGRKEDWGSRALQSRRADGSRELHAGLLEKDNTWACVGARFSLQNPKQIHRRCSASWLLFSSLLELTYALDLRIFSSYLLSFADWTLFVCIFILHKRKTEVFLLTGLGLAILHR